jgi:hypothetical protein
MKVSTEDLVAVLRMIAKDLQCPDGVANVFIDGAANRMTLLANLAAKHVEEMEAANQRIKRLEEDSHRLNWLLNRGVAWRDCYNDWWKEGEWLYASQSALATIDKAKEAKP